MGIMHGMRKLQRKIRRFQNDEQLRLGSKRITGSDLTLVPFMVICVAVTVVIIVKTNGTGASGGKASIASSHSGDVASVYHYRFGSARNERACVFYFHDKYDASNIKFFNCGIEPVTIMHDDVVLGRIASNAVLRIHVSTVDDAFDQLVAYDANDQFFGRLEPAWTR